MAALSPAKATTGLYVITRSGAKEPCRFDKITDRITSLAYGLHELVDPVRAAPRLSARVSLPL
jgi:hypothetical protein